MNNGNDGIHSKAEGFDDNEEVQRDDEHQARLNAMMREHMALVQKELEAGTLHGLVIVRVNEDHQTASCIAICNDAARDVGLKLQEMSMDLVLPPEARRELKQLMGMLRQLG
jgi:hypothetical protein